MMSGEIVPTIVTRPESNQAFSASSPFICLLLTTFSALVPSKAPPSLAASKAQIRVSRHNQPTPG